MTHSWKIFLKQGLIVAAGILVLVSADYLGLFVRFDYACNDMFFSLRGANEPDRRIIIAAVDEKTLKRLGRWPLRRMYYARLLEAVREADAVGFDILMSEPSVDDAVLAMAAKKHGAVVFPTYLERFTGAQDSSPAIATRLTGHVHLEQDSDGVVRRLYHTISLHGTAIPSFSSALHEVMTKRRFHHGTIHGNNSDGTIFQMDENTLNYSGPPGTFPHVSMVDILDGRFPPAFFAHRIVLVGTTAEGLENGILTPFREDRARMSGVEVHANALNNLLNRNSVTESPDPARWFLSICLSMFGLLAFRKASNRWLMIVWLLGVAVVTTGAFLLFSRFGIWFSPVLFSILLTFMLISDHLFRLQQAGRELLSAKEEWEESFNTINDAIVLMDCEGRITRSNKASELLPKEVTDSLSLTCRESGKSDTDSSSVGTGFIQEIETRSSDSERYFEIKSLPRFDANGEKIGFVHVVLDVSSRKKAEAEKEAIHAQLLQSQKMESVGRMAAGITHDFNNLLTAILGFSELAIMRIPPEDPLRNDIQIIHDSGLKAAQLTRQLLAFSRKQVMHLQVLNLSHIVNALSKILSRIIGEDMTLKLLTDKSARYIKADAGHLEQVIINLAVNARDAMPRGGTLTIETFDVFLDEEYARSHFGIEPGNYVTLRMTDTGTGMTKEVQTKIFEPFFTTKKSGEGTGLGLSTVYGIVKQLSGHIQVYSEVGAGSVFTIYLPACETQEESTPGQRVSRPQHGSEKILVAEDDPIVRQLIADTLEPLGYRVSLAASYAEAIRLMETAAPGFQILLTDVIMPEAGGKELAESFRKRCPTAAVIFMSGYPVEIIARRGLDPDCISFMQKPLIPNRLIAKIREVLDGTPDTA